MEIVLFFGLFFISIFLSFFYFSRKVIYLGVLGGIIFILLGIFLAATGYIEIVTCTSVVENATVNGSLTTYDYLNTCFSENLELGRDTINAIGTILMFLGAGMVVDFLINTRREEDE